jgi:dTDP-4-dehydrorhamnose reductase
MKTIAVIGGSGMVASRFIDLATKSFDITLLDEKTLDITDNTAVENYFSENNYDAVINFAAYTDRKSVV